MSKLRSRIRDVGRAPAGFGFARPAAQDRPRHVLVIARAGSAAEAKRALDDGADAVLIEGDAADAKGLAVGHPVGLRLPTATADEVRAAEQAGVDFFVFDDGVSHANALSVTELGRVLDLGDDHEEHRLRALSALDLDAVLVHARTGTITVRDQLALRRVAGLIGSPLLIEPDGQPDAAALEVWRDAGAPAVLVPAAQATAAVEAASHVPPPRKRSTGAMPVVPSMGGGGHHHDGDDDDDD